MCAHVRVCLHTSDDENGCIDANGNSDGKSLVSIIIGAAAACVVLALGIVWFFVHKRVNQQFTPQTRVTADAEEAVTVHVEPRRHPPITVEISPRMGATLTHTHTHTLVYTHILNQFVLSFLVRVILISYVGRLYWHTLGYSMSTMHAHARFSWLSQ
jgi:hypothetical protein